MTGRSDAGVAVISMKFHESRRRSDIQGLRAILMGQVLLYHAWGIGSPIGVDSFIMISAYLMTSSFLRRTELGQMPVLIERWGNTFKRLLPSLVVVVLATLGASLLILSADRWREMTIQSFASITYWENWRLATVSADYYADDHALSSPLQHLWSMSMQGQIFLLWPLLMTLCVLVARRTGTSPRGMVVAAFGLLAASSLLWLVFFSPNSAAVYFDTRSRIWEFALGSMIAASAPWLKLPRSLTRWLLPVAFTVLVVYCLVPIGSYPGPMATMPMLSVSAILLFNPVAPGDAVSKVLSWRPLEALGDVSYAVYLVHWPIFVLYLARVNRPQLGMVDGLLLVVISILSGWLLTKLIDDPLRKFPWSNRSTRNKYVIVGLSLVIGLIPVAAVWVWLNDRISEEVDATEVVHSQGDSQRQDDQPSEVRLNELIPVSGPGSAGHPGAWVLLGDADSDFAGIESIPDAITSAQQLNYDHECPQLVTKFFGGNASRFCSSMGDFDIANKTVLVAGSSHAQQLLTWQVPPLVESLDGAALSILYPACPWTYPGNLHQECSEQNARTLSYVEAYPPDYAFLIVSQTVANAPHEYLLPGVVELVEELVSRGVTVFGISDNLRSDENLYECSNERPDDAPYGGCLLPENEHFADASILEPLLEIDGFHFIDMRDAYCIDGVCPTIVGNIWVYFDNNHVTTAYTRSVAPFFSQRVLDVLSDLEESPTAARVENGLLDNSSFCSDGACEGTIKRIEQRLTTSPGRENSMGE